MLIKKSAFVASVFLIILCVTTIQAIPQLGSESPIVDTVTIEHLKENISDYLVELEHGGSPQMQLKQIYSASKQTVTGTLYTIEALIATPDGEKKCKIRVLEKPWIDFCKVSLTCENGGFYEVTFNPNQDNLQNVLNTNHFSTSAFQKPEVKKPQLTSFKPQQTVFKSPFATQAPQQFEFKPQSPSQFTVNNIAKPQTFAPAPVNNIFEQNPTPPPQKFEFNPQKSSQFTVKSQTLSPVTQFPVSNNFYTSAFQKSEVNRPQFTPFKTQQTNFKSPFTTQASPKFEFIPQQPSKFIVKNFAKPQTFAPAPVNNVVKQIPQKFDFNFPQQPSQLKPQTFAPVPAKFDFTPQTPSQFQVNNFAKPQTFAPVPAKFDFKPQTLSQFQVNNFAKPQTYAPASFVKQQFTPAPVKFDFKPQTQQYQPQILPSAPPKSIAPQSVFDFKPQKPSQFQPPQLKPQTFAPVPAKFDFKLQTPSQFQVNNFAKPQTFAPANFVKQQITPAPVKFDFEPQTQQYQNQILPSVPPKPVTPQSVFDFKPRPEVQNLPPVPPKEEILPPVPFDFQPQQQFDQQQFTHPVEPAVAPLPVPAAAPLAVPAAALAPQSVPAKAPELNVLPFDQLPQGEALNTYLVRLFHDFMKVYDRAYINEPHEMEHRFNLFTENFRTMLEHSKSDHSCEYSVTQFSDLSQSEFERILGFDTSALNVTNAETVPSEPSGRTSSDGEIPEKYDQRDEGIVTRVKHQGDCGACWAFITNAVIEGMCAKRTKKLQEFSEQSLIDCDKSNYGCKGGVPSNAYKHIFKRGGLELETVYPYVYGKSTCHFEPKTVRVKLSGGLGFKKGDEANMAKWLYKNGPIAVGVNAAPLKYYKRGILNPTESLCSPKKIDHGLTLIGYGVEVDKKTGEKLPYWIAKNSWGTSFGEDGFVRIARGKNACGLALWASSAKLANVENNCLLQGA